MLLRAKSESCYVNPHFTNENGERGEEWQNLQKMGWWAIDTKSSSSLPFNYVCPMVWGEEKTAVADFRRLAGARYGKLVPIGSHSWSITLTILVQF